MTGLDYYVMVIAASGLIAMAFPDRKVAWGLVCAMLVLVFLASLPILLEMLADARLDALLGPVIITAPQAAAVFLGRWLRLRLWGRRVPPEGQA